MSYGYNEQKGYKIDANLRNQGKDNFAQQFHLNLNLTFALKCQILLRCLKIFMNFGADNFGEKSNLVLEFGKKYAPGQSAERLKISCSIE